MFICDSNAQLNQKQNEINNVPKKILYLFVHYPTGQRPNYGVRIIEQSQLLTIT